MQRNRATPPNTVADGFRPAGIGIYILELRQLSEHAVRLIVVASASRSHEETVLVSEHRLNLVVRQTRQVLWVQERVAAAVQSHLTVDLYIDRTS